MKHACDIRDMHVQINSAAQKTDGRQRNRRLTPARARIADNNVNYEAGGKAWGK